MFEQKKKEPSPFGGGEEKTESFEVRGTKPKEKPSRPKADIKEMLAKAAEKKKKARKGSPCGCW